MNVKIIDGSFKPLETLYIAFRTCYSKDIPTKIKIPVKKQRFGIYFDEKYTPDTDEMIEFIKDKIGKGHDSPLEHVSFTFAIEGVSRSLSHQLVRHRTFKFSQQSQRYVNAACFDFITPETIKNNGRTLGRYLTLLQKIKDCYTELVCECDMPKEDARYILPNATTTNLIVTADLRNFRHFYTERSCIHAQAEIRELAYKMMEEVKQRVPFASYKAKKCGTTCFECQQESKTVNLNHITIDCREEK